MIPSLLLRPEGSYSWSPENGVQVVTPTVGSNVDVVDGQFGKAWDTSNGHITLLDNGYASAERGTVVIRMLATHTPNTTKLLWEVQRITPRLNAYVTSPGEVAVWIGGTSSVSTGITVVTNQHHALGIVWTPTERRIAMDGESPFVTLGTPPPSITDEWWIGASRINTSGTHWHGKIESVLIFPEALPDAEIHRISTMPEAWTMDNVATPEMRIMLDGEVVRASGMYSKKHGLLKPARLG